MALRCPNLIKFVYISTAFAGAFLRETPDRRVIGSDALVKEDINDIRCTKLLASTELHDLETYGTTPELVVHVARGTTGIVHAVARRDDHISIATVWKHAAKLRRFWWGMPKLKWNTEHWKSPEQSALARLYVVMGCSFTFEEGQTTVAWNHMSSAEREAWPLWGKEGDSATERLDRRNEALVAMVDKLLSKYSKTTFLKAKIVMDI
ncbi:hypothetical protein ACLX1H_008975 [Fusarium chlamydosporum]